MEESASMSQEGSQSSPRHYRSHSDSDVCRVTMVPFVFTAAILIAVVSANPLKDPDICGRPTCISHDKFRYRKDIAYLYQYSSDISTLFNGTSENKSTLHIAAHISLEFRSPCEGVLKVFNVSLTEAAPLYDREEDQDILSPELPQSKEFGEAISKHPLRFSFSDGILPEVCAHENETSWVLNFKKGILSTFQNTMKRFDIDHQHIDIDVNGHCETTYKMEGARETNLIIQKTKEISSCTHRYKHHSIIQTTPYMFRNNFQPLPIMKSNSTCEMSVNHNIYNKIVCEELHKFQPFSSENSGALTRIKQVITLIGEGNATMEGIEQVKQRSSLLFDHNQTPKPVSGELKASRDLIKAMCRLHTDDVEPEFPTVFTKFVHTARLLSYPALSQIYFRAGSMCSTGRRHVLDALPMLGSNAAIAVMRDIILKADISKEMIDDWLFAISFLPKPDLQTVTLITPLVMNAAAPSTLSVSSVVHTYCKWNANCGTREEVIKIVSHLEKQVRNGCEGGDKTRGELEKTLISIKALGNIGVYTRTLYATLKQCTEDEDLPMQIRVAAIEAHRRLPCEGHRDYFLERFRNQSIDSELRIASYLEVMRCPTYIVVKTIKHSLHEEQINQVGSFIWTHLTNLLKSSTPSRVEIQGLLQDKDLIKKFSSDVRKFSNNFEGSIFFEDYNVGANYDSNVIFSSKSYIPRSAMFNFTIDLFGESINLFEVAGRMEGFEHYMEQIFGPNGPISKAKVAERVEKSLEKFRFLRSAQNDLKSKVESLPNMVENMNFDYPKASLALKIFGNELKYYSFEGDSEIRSALNSINPWENMKLLLSGKEINYDKATLLMDTSYVVPTGMGLPLSLSALGTAAVSLQLSGSLKASNLMKTGELDIEGKIRPSVAVDIVGTMSVDAYHANTGIKLKTNMYSSSAVEGHLKVRGKRLVSLTFDLPKDKIEIINAQSELVVMHGDKEEILSGTSEGRTEDHVCSWPTLDRTLGLKFCADYEFPNITLLRNMTEFVLTGPTKFSVSLQKADPTAKKYVLEYKWDVDALQKNSTVISLSFDTPGSNISREMSAKLYLDKNSQNLTLLLKSAESKFQAHGKYKNTEAEKYIQFGLKINGQKHFDAEVGMNTTKVKYGHIYQPKLYLAINNERIAHLSGFLKWIEKKGISQCDVNLEFATKKVATKLHGYVRKSEASVSTNLKLNYQFPKAKAETVKIEANLSNRSTRNLDQINGDLQVESSQYPHFNFLSSLRFQRAKGPHIECRIEVNSGQNMTDDRNKLTIQMVYAHHQAYEGHKTNAFIHITKPVSGIDLKLSVLHHSTGHEQTVVLTIRYATGKEIIISFNLINPRGSLTFIDAKLNVTVPSFTPMLLDLRLHEKVPNEYDIELMGTWFSGHTLTAKGLYQDRSTAKITNHNLKLLIKSPSFNEIALIVKFLRDDEEFKFEAQADHNKDKYSVMLKHVQPSQTEFQTYIDLRYQKKVYTVTASVNLLNYKQVLLELHLDQYRDVVIVLKGANQRDQKEAGIEIKWDANRDPGQKFAAAVAFYGPEYMNYSGNFLVVYPGRTVKGDFMMVMKGSAYNSSAHLEWSDEDAIDMVLVALYDYTDAFNLRMNCELLSPFENWKRTSIAGGVHYIENLLRMNGSVHWQDDQSISMDVFGDYVNTEDELRCEFNATVLSTIEEVSSMAGGFYHKHGAKNVDTKVHLQYHPEQTITVHSMWEIERDLDWSNVTGIVNLVSPYEGYRRGELRSRIHISKEWELTGAAEMTVDTRKYTLTAEGHLKELTNSMLTFNITTPFQNHGLITGQLGYSEAKRHLVAQVMGPSGGLGIEILLSIISTTDFDVKLSVATPMDFLQKALVVGKLKKDEVDFRCGWNSLVLGFSGIWHYENITDFEYSYRIYTPLEGFEETGVVAKLIYKEGLDFQVALILTDLKLGIRLHGAPKPKLLKDLNVEPKLLEGETNPDYGEDGDESAEEEENEEEEEALSWNGLVELDTVLYPTMRGTLEIDERGTVYHIVASVQFPDGVVHLHDEFDFIDYLTMNNRLHLTTPCEWFKELISTYSFEFVIGEHYVTSLDIRVKSQNEWINSGLMLNYTYEVGEGKSGIHQTKFKMFTPIETVKLIEVHNILEMHKNKWFCNYTLSTPGSRFSTEGYLELREEYTNASLAFGLISPVYNISNYKIQALKDVANAEKKLLLEVKEVNSELNNLKAEVLWIYEDNVMKKGHILINTPLEQISHLSIDMIYVVKQDSSTDFEIVMELPQDKEVQINLILDGDTLRVHLNLPIEGFSDAEIEGTVKSAAPGHKSITAVMRSEGSEDKIDGTITMAHDMPLAMQLTVSQPKNIRIELKIQKLPDGMRVESAVKRGPKDNFIVNGEYHTIPGSQWNMAMKVLTSHEIYKSFAVNGKLLLHSNQNVSTELSVITSIKGYENLRASGYYLISKRNGVLEASFDLSQVKGKVETEWIFYMLENMGLKVAGFYETMNSSTYLSSELFYKNPKKRFEDFTSGMDINVNKGLWQIGANFTLKFPAYNNVTVEYNIILPPPHAEAHKVYGKIEYENDLSYMSEVLKYSTFHSKKLYGTFGKLHRKQGKLDGDLKLIWGKENYKTILNVLKVAKEEKHIDVLYTLTTPKYLEEETFVVKGSYDKEGDIYKVKGSVLCPASNFISGGHVDFRSIYNTQGMLNTTTPFITIPYVGVKFKASTLALHYQRFLEIFWPNNSALFDSQYNYENKNYNTQINGSVVVEVPLQNRHIGKLVYGYKEGPLHTTGYSAVEYNGNRFLEGKYNCDSQSSAGFEKDVIDIEIENEYSPLGIHYVHQFEYSGGSDGLNLPTTDMKRAELFKLNNRTEFNLTGEVKVHSTLTGQDITLTAIHMNRTVRLQTDYDFLDHEFKQRSVLHLDPQAWASYDITINNKTTAEKEEQHTELNFAYPKRNFTLLGYYQLSNNSLSSEVTFIWDKQARKKSVGTSFDWKRLSVYPNKHHAVLSLKHPSFKRDVTLNCQYAADEKVLVDVVGDLEYSTDESKKLSLSGKLKDNSQGANRHYSVEILGSHPATRLDLKVNGEVKLEQTLYELNNHGQYKRSYLPLQIGNIKARLNTILKEVEMERRSQKDLSYLKAKYTPANPIYILNGTALKGRDLNATGEFMLNIDEKLIFGNINFTSDGSEAFHMYGNIPDARNTIFNIWRDYEEIRVSDVSFYLRLNHSRLVTSKLKWRPEIKNEILTGIHDAVDALWNGFLNYMDYWKQYIKSETVDAVNDIWGDAKPIVQSFLDDVSELQVLADDFEEFKIYLNNSYNANEFYIRDIVDMVNYVIDELSLRGHIESLPNILKEVWEVMGESGEALRKSLLWIIETIKASYQKAVEFINGLLKGDSTAQITEMLEKLVEKYDRFIKDLHVAFLKHVENLWMKISQFLWKNWYSFLRTIEPTFIKVLHYLESMVWKASKEILDFLYERRNDIVGSPYFSKIANLTADIERIYKDFKNHDLLTNIKKYSHMIYEFLREKYFTMVPFGKELQQIANEIIDEFKELGKLPSIRYATQKMHELYERVHWFYNSLDIGTKFQKLVKLIHTKLTDITNTALQTENRYRGAKTKFIFEPENGYVIWEQKLPMSWHAFNETPKFEEIPEYRTLNDIQNYFVASNTTFWSLYYEYKPYTELSNWLPPFKAQALVAGTQHFMTFDRSFFEFHGQCSYLLASDFMDHNFSAVITYDPNSKTEAYEIAVIIGNEVVHINLFDESVRLHGQEVRHLPLAIQDAYIYQEASMITIDSPRGFTIQCNLKFDVCTFTLTGWYFGKTAGLLGTLDNEPSTDLLSSRNTMETEIVSFAQSWSLEPQKCSSKNFAREIAYPDENVYGICESFFRLKTSQFSSCFPVVNPLPFWKMCINSAENSERDTCAAAVAYMQACLMENTPLRIPDACVKCELTNGTQLVEGDFRQLEGRDVPQSTDVVFIIEAKDCNKDLKQKRNMDSIVSLLAKELADLKLFSNRYAVVTFGGDGVYDKPRSVVLDNKIFTTQHQISQYFEYIPVGNGNADIFRALRFASKLLFRSGVSKTFILIPCTDCSPENTTLDYTVLHQVLLENDITLHILMNDEFSFEKGKMNKLFYGMDGETAYTKKDVKTLEGSVELRRQVKLPKENMGYCAALALETNGTVFTAKKLETDKKNMVKKFATVFAKRVAKTAVPCDCQTCECTADNNGMSYMECFPCMYPSPASINYDFTEDIPISKIPNYSEEEEESEDYAYDS